MLPLPVVAVRLVRHYIKNFISKHNHTALGIQQVQKQGSSEEIIAHDEPSNTKINKSTNKKKRTEEIDETLTDARNYPHT